MVRSIRSLYAWPLKGDLGTSIRTGAAIAQEMKPYLFATLELTFCHGAGDCRGSECRNH